MTTLVKNKILNDILTAQFYEDSDGNKELRIRQKYWRNGVKCHPINPDGTGKFVRNEEEKAIFDYCMSFGFQANTFIIDNRNKTELVEDYNRAQARCAASGIAGYASYQDWLSQQVLCF